MERKRSYRYTLAVLGLCVAFCAMPGVSEAATVTYQLHSHPDGNQNPPPYGLRLNGLFGGGAYTFDFDYTSITEDADVKLEYDDVTEEIHIFGRAYGGKDAGTDYDPGLSGWVDIDFTYRANVVNGDTPSGGAGPGLYVDPEDLTNNGTVTLDGWGGNAVLAINDKQGANPYSFGFDNDIDSKGNAGIMNDPNIFSGSGWVQGVDITDGDWIFTGELLTPSATETASWGSVKELFR